MPARSARSSCVRPADSRSSRRTAAKGVLPRFCRVGHPASVREVCGLCGAVGEGTSAVSDQTVEREATPAGRSPLGVVCTTFTCERDCHLAGIRFATCAWRSSSSGGWPRRLGARRPATSIDRRRQPGASPSCSERDIDPPVGGGPPGGRWVVDLLVGGPIGHWRLVRLDRRGVAPGPPRDRCPHADCSPEWCRCATRTSGPGGDRRVGPATPTRRRGAVGG